MRKERKIVRLVPQKFCEWKPYEQPIRNREIGILCAKFNGRSRDIQKEGRRANLKKHVVDIYIKKLVC